MTARLSSRPRPQTDEPGLEIVATQCLKALNFRGGYAISLVCTEQGLLIAEAGDLARSEIAAGITSLLSDISHRATRDLDADCIDEMTLLSGRGRLIVRSITPGFSPQLFLVILAPRDATWRRLTNSAAKTLSTLLRPLLDVDNPAQNSSMITGQPRLEHGL